MTNFWTSDRRARVAELLKEGDSANEIAAKLGASSRSAVISVVRRDKNIAAIGFERAQGETGLRSEAIARKPRTNGFAAVNAARRVQRLNASPGLAPDVLEPVPDDPGPEPRMIPLVELTDRTCKWPIGDPKEPGFGFCGADKPLDGKPYCAYHARLVYAPRSKVNERGAA